MPADQRGRRHHQPRPPATAQQTAQRGQERTVLGFKARSRVLAPENLELVTQDDDLDLLGIPGTEQHQEQFHHTADAEVDQGPNHHILPADRQRPSTATRSPVAANSLVTRHGRVLTPHGAGSELIGAPLQVDADGTTFEAVTRIDTPTEATYFRHAGILRYVVRHLATPPA